jgi:hypothetical protein
MFASQFELRCPQMTDNVPVYLQVIAFQHFINANNGAKIAKYLSRVVRRQFWQYAR